MGQLFRRPRALYLVAVLLLALAIASSSPIGSVHAAPPAGFKNERLIIGLDEPVDLVFAADHRMFIAEGLTGKILLVQPGATTPEPTPLNTIISTGTGEKGIHGLALDPEFMVNGYYYVFYTRNGRDVVSRFTASGNTTVPNSEVVIWSDSAEVGKWTHVAVTRDAAKTRRIYVNGTEASVANNTPDPIDSSGTFTFGRAGDAGAS